MLILPLKFQILHFFQVTLSLKFKEVIYMLNIKDTDVPVIQLNAEERNDYTVAPGYFIAKDNEDCFFVIEEKYLPLVSPLYEIE